MGTRIYGPKVRILLIHPEAFETEDDFLNPSAAVLNGPLAYNITCAVNQDGTTFDLGDSETDDSLTFCQVAGAQNPTDLNPEIVLEIERSADPLEVNTANTAFGLLAFPDIEYFALLSVGEDPDEPFAAGQQVKLARVATDTPVDVMGVGENVRLSQTMLNRTDLAWNVEVAA